ncbi:LacI family DNA-binding transcriptional regulator [Deinococcus gobiensis]|uniref:LacI family DNA-binding transcriptional regulator n=1 Tax=Deinococcus gobiensis TaxID=502394 RepID=UPI000308A294|nr:LacI family DNA-binding transcriptional regulator [Deinococcus gobiensis]
MPPAPKPEPAEITLADVAQVARVSKMTVSNVLNGKPNVKASTRQRVLSAVEATGYRANPVARALAGQRHRLLSLVARRSNLPYVTEVIRGASEAAEALEYDLVVLMVGQRQSSDLSLFLRLSQGAAFVHADAPGLGVPPGDLPLHCVTVDGPTHDSLRVDNLGGSRAATRHLLELGHTRIAFVSGLLALSPEASLGRSDAAERLRGYQDTLEEAGLTLPEAYLQHGDYSPESGERAARALLALPEPPTAIFAAGDAMAVAVIHAAQDLGRRVPTDLSVVGFDDLPFFRGVRPALTTVAQPLGSLGEEAVRHLARLAQGETPAALPPPLATTLVVRDSAAPPPPHQSIQTP